MTDNSDRQDRDGLLAADELFESSVLAAMHATLSSAVIEAMTAMIRDADAGVTIQRATLPTILFAKEILATCATSPTRDGAEGADDLPPDAEHPINYRKAFAKPAPDAMREVIRNAMNHLSHSGLILNDNESLEYLTNAVATTGVLSAPVPPADGASETLMGPGIDKLFERDDLFTARAVCARLRNFGYNITLSTSPAVAAEPDKQMLEYARRLNDIATDCELASGLSFADYIGHASDLRRIAQQIVASPTVRGDRESSPDDIRAHGWTVAVHNDYRQGGEAHTFWLFTNGRENAKGEGKTDAEALNQVRAVLSLPVQPVAPRLPRDTLDRLANTDASAEEIKDALAKAYAILRWNAKLDDLPDDMKDDCYGFAGSVQSAGERETTPDMRIAGGIAWAEALKTAETYVDCADACWKAMWDARPSPEREGADIEGFVSGPYKYEKDLHACFRVIHPDERRLVACVYATAGEEQAEADAELFARALRQAPHSSSETES